MTTTHASLDAARAAVPYAVLYQLQADGSCVAYGPADTLPEQPTDSGVPAEVTMRQARLALHRAGLLASVAPAINAMSEPAKTEAQIEWEYSQTVQRHKGLTAAIGAALGLTDAQMDQLFITAATL